MDQEQDGQHDTGDHRQQHVGLGEVIAANRDAAAAASWMARVTAPTVELAAYRVVQESLTKPDS